MNETTETDEGGKPRDPAQTTEEQPSPEQGASEPSVADAATVAPEDEGPREVAFHPAQDAASARPVATVLAGGLAGAVLSAAVLWYALPDSAISPEVARRLTTLETGAASANAALEHRIAALEAGSTLQSDKMAGVSGFGPRLSALEAAAPETKAAAEMSKTALSEAQAARADAAKALQSAGQPSGDSVAAAPSPSDSGAQEARIGKLEAGLAALSADKVDLAPLNERLAKLETALAAQKSAERVAPEPAPPSRDNAAMLAVAAQALASRLAAGAPYPLEQAALERLGADPQRLAVLKPFASAGGPNTAALASEFAKIAPAMLTAAEPKSDDGVMARLMTNMSKIVRIHPVGEQAGDDPAALVSQISAALERGDVAGALAAYARLPDVSREVGKEWAAHAKARVDAIGAAQALADDAIARLGAAKN
jgi:hypothetical protein